MSLTKISWWKWLGVLLLGYAVIAGTSVPTGPGVSAIVPDVMRTDDAFEIVVQGYNTHVSEADQNKVWLKVDSMLYCASSVEVMDADLLKASFAPIHRSNDEEAVATVVVENSVDGMFLGVKALRLSQTVEQEITPECTNRPEKLNATYFSFPYRGILYETIRNLNYHVPMWFTMIALLLVAFIYSIMLLNTGNQAYDHQAYGFSAAGILFGLMGVETGAFWARHTWGVYWTSDPKLNGAAIALLMYLAYMILRSAIEDQDKRSRISAVYNILAYPLFIVLIIVLPKVADFSLHPGSGDSVGFNTYDLNNNLRKVFYPAVVGWILLGVWIAELTTRLRVHEHKRDLL